MKCSLCQSTNSAKKYSRNKVSKIERDYYLCSVCDFVFVPKQFHLAERDEKHKYDEHQNYSENQGYIDFLQPVLNQVLKVASKEDAILDFGCGPGPVLADLLKEQGYSITLYDPYYFPEVSVLEKKYDIVVSTEVVEHFCQPIKSWELLFSLVNSQSKLIIKTALRDNAPDFKDWHYQRDITHVAFYSKLSMCWIAKYFGYKVEFVGNDLMCFELCC